MLATACFSWSMLSTLPLAFTVKRLPTTTLYSPYFEWDTQSKYGEYSVVVGKRFTVKANGNVDSIDQLKQAVASIDLAKLESLKDVGVKSN